MSDSAPAPSDRSDSLIGLTVDHGRYEIVKLIGQGGMGRVFQARQVSMNRMVALKLLRAQLATDPNLLARFEQEALSVSRLRHPNTITVYDYGRTEDGFLFIAMELLGGRPLAQVLRDDGRLALPRALHVMEQVVGAVAEAHQLGIVHRDLKPENIQLDKVANDPDFAKVLDFGIAKIIHGEEEPDGASAKTLTMAGAVVGTPHYMSPEQVHGLKVDHRTDLYSLGVILYELLVGRPPFEGTTPMAVMMAQASKAPPDIRQAHPDVPVSETVAELINSCLVKDRADRLGSANDMLNVLRHARLELGDLSAALSGRIQYDPALASAVMRRRTIDTPGGAGASGSNAGTPAPAVSAETPRPSTPVEAVTLSPPRPDSVSDVLPEIRSPRYGRVGLVVLALALLGGGVWFAMRSDPPVTVPVGEPVRIEVKGDPKPIHYRIESDPPGARVSLGAEELGTTPFEREWPGGSRPELTLTLDGHVEENVTLAGSGDPRQTLRVSLRPKPAAPAWLRLTSKPDGAEVYDGEALLGTTPFDWKPAADGGKRELRFAKKGFDDARREVTLTSATEALAIEVELPAAKPTPVGLRPRPPAPVSQAAKAPPPPSQGHKPAPPVEKPPPRAPESAPDPKKPDRKDSPYEKL